MINIKGKKMHKKIFKKWIKSFLSQGIYLLAMLRFRLSQNKVLKNKSLLIIKLDAIGDYVLFRNFLEEVKNSEIYKGYKITFLGNQANRNLAETLDCDYVDEFIWIDRKKLFKNPFYFLKVANQVYGKYTVAIQATHSREFIGDVLIKLSEAEERIGFSGDCNNITPKEKIKTDRWYTRLIDIDPKIVFEFNKNKAFFEKILDENIFLNKPLIKVDNATLKNSISLPANFVVLFPGGSQTSKQWPADKFRLVAKYIIEKFDMDIVICGSSSDSILARTININGDSRFTDFTGKTSLIELALIISKSKLVISNDTSGAHFGAALDIPTIVLSRYNHYLRFVPYPKEISDKMICLLPHIFEDLSEEELIEKFKFGSSEDISLISVDEVKQAINKLLL
jgi:ADP-heptose:LPS heptosyltransferase